MARIGRARWLAREMGTAWPTTNEAKYLKSLCANRILTLLLYSAVSTVVNLARQRMHGWLPWPLPVPTVAWLHERLGALR